MSVDLPTLLFQSVNFLVLVVLLWRLLLRPLRRHMQDRAARISRDLAEVATGQQELAKSQMTIDSELQEARRVRRSALEEARAQADAERLRIVEQAREQSRSERDTLLAGALDEQARQQSHFLQGLAPALTQLLAGLLRELGDAANLHVVTCQRFADHLANLSADQRDELSRAGAVGFSLVVARGPVPRALLCAAERIFKSPVTRIDASLIAGAQLVAGDTVLDGSVRTQITHALARLQ